MVGRCETTGRRQEEVQVGAAQDGRAERGTEKSGDLGGATCNEAWGLSWQHPCWSQ